MGIDRNARGKGRSWGDGDSFFALHDNVALSPGYRQVSHTARSLLVDIGLQYNGKNNGRLIAAQKYLRPLGWKSSNVVTWALRELLAGRLLVETTKGGINRPSRFALAWQPLDWDKSMEFTALVYQSVHRYGYMKPDPTPVRPSHKAARVRDSSTPPGDVEASPITSPGGVEQASGAPPGDVMPGEFMGSATSPGGACIDVRHMRRHEEHGGDRLIDCHS
jgi:hypothetical protein